jgi:type II secretory pathway predicted ATPase ExeA
MVLKTPAALEADEIAGYERHFGLREPPFTLTANTRFTFPSRAYSVVVDAIVRSLERHEPLLVVTGLPGSGKTLVSRTVAGWRNERTFVASISIPAVDRDDLLRLILDEFGVLPRDSRRSAEAGHFELTRTLQQFLESLGSLNARAVIVVDDAHRLSTLVLQELRSLVDFETEARKLLQIVLLGEPPLLDLLATPALSSLNQRVTRRYVLEPMTAEEVQPYIEHRWLVAQDTHDKALPLTPAFARDALVAIPKLSRGVPRVVNVLCDRALETAHALELPKVNLTALFSAAEGLGVRVPVSLRLRRHRAKLAAVAALAIIATAGWLVVDRLPFNRRSESVQAAPQSPAPRQVFAAKTTPAPPVVEDAAKVAAEANKGVEPSRAAPLVASTGARGFVIVASSFRTPSRANSLADRVKALDLPARVRFGSGWHQVVVGPFSTHDEAEEARNTLKKADVDDALIVPSNSTSAPTSTLASSPTPPASSPPPRPAAPIPPAVAPAPRSAGTSIERARALAQSGDVRGVLRIRDETESQLLRAGRSGGEIERALNPLDELLEQARRRRLELDGSALQKPQ